MELYCPKCGNALHSRGDDIWACEVCPDEPWYHIIEVGDCISLMSVPNKNHRRW